MTKAKKLLYVLLRVIMLIATACCFVGCDKTNDGETKYDVTAKVVATRGGTQIGEWIFTPDVKELTVEFEYTGEEIEVYIDKFIINDPSWGVGWATPSSHFMPCRFRIKMTYVDTLGAVDTTVENVIARGTYRFRWINETSRYDLNVRAFYLYVKVV